MDHNERIPDAVVRRLPGYYRNLRELEADGVSRLSSKALGIRMGLTASQIRQDINYFGGFGQQGYGYHVQTLKRYIGQILGLDKPHHTVVVGAGNIGNAVAHYPTFRNEGFEVRALFDVNPALVGKTVLGAPILPLSSLERYLAANRVDILVIATPREEAQAAMDMAIRAGVPGVWNFAPADLIAPPEIEVVNVHLSDTLMALSFRLHERAVLGGERHQWVKE